jgi:Rad3-related DNA helicase
MTSTELAAARERLGVPSWRTRLVMKNVAERDREIYSDESYEALTTRLREFRHPRMPVRRIKGMRTVGIEVNRPDVVIIENVEEPEA